MAQGMGAWTPDFSLRPYRRTITRVANYERASSLRAMSTNYRPFLRNAWSMWRGIARVDGNFRHPYSALLAQRRQEGRDLVVEMKKPGGFPTGFFLTRQGLSSVTALHRGTCGTESRDRSSDHRPHFHVVGMFR
jgi:hypothetical protein